MKKYWIVTVCTFFVVKVFSQFSFDMLPAFQYTPNEIQLVDINQDGELDLVVSNLSSFNVEVFKGCNGSFESPLLVEMRPLSGYISGMKFADFNNDGFPDMLYQSYSSSGAFLGVSVGDGTFDIEGWKHIHGITGITGNKAFLIGDFNNDGLEDIVRSSPLDGKLRLMRNQGNTNFISSFIALGLPLGVRDIRAGDLDNDGDLDIVGIDGEKGWCGVFENLGNNEFEEHVVFHNPLETSNDFALLDVDGDQDLDIVMSKQGSVVWYENEPGIQFLVEHLIEDVSISFSNMQIKDLDNDGFLDIVASSGYKCIWFENLGNGTIEPYEILFESENLINRLQTADLDHDTDFDFIASSEAASSLFLFKDKLVSDTILSVNYTSDLPCSSSIDGMISIEYSECENFEISWSDTSLTGFYLTELSSGSYSYEITNINNGEIFSDTLVIVSPDSIDIDILSIHDATDGMNNGIIEIMVSGGSSIDYSYEWYNLNGDIIGTEMNAYELFAGSYYVVVTDSLGCTQASEIIFIDEVVGVKNQAKNDLSIEVFPNPTKGILNIINTSDETIKSIKLSNSNGSYFELLPSILEQTMIDLTNVPNGLYFLSFQLESRIITKKIIVSK